MKTASTLPRQPYNYYNFNLLFREPKNRFFLFNVNGDSLEAFRALASRVKFSLHIIVPNWNDPIFYARYSEILDSCIRRGIQLVIYIADTEAGKEPLVLTDHDFFKKNHSPHSTSNSPEIIKIDSSDCGKLFHWYKGAHAECPVIGDHNLLHIRYFDSTHDARYSRTLINYPREATQYLQKIESLVPSRSILDIGQSVLIR